MREREPYWKSSHKCWYFRHEGKETRLNPDNVKAWKRWHDIKGGVIEVTKDTKFKELIADFLDFSEKDFAKAKGE